MRKFVLLLIVAFILTACGKKGPLIYPDLLTPAAPSEVSASQLDMEVKISFALPQKDQAGRSLKNLAGVDIYKRSAISGQPVGCTACTADYALFKKIYLNSVDSQVVRNNNQIVFLDSEVRVERDYSYYIIAFGNDNVFGKSSVPVVISVAVAPSAPRLKAVAEPTEIRLLLTAPITEKQQIAGYNLYRAEKGLPLTIFRHNKELIKGNSYTDIGLKRGVSYIYAVRTVVKKNNGTFGESQFSNLVETKLAEE